MIAVVHPSETLYETLYGTLITDTKNTVSPSSTITS